MFVILDIRDILQNYLTLVITQFVFIRAITQHSLDRYQLYLIFHQYNSEDLLIIDLQTFQNCFE